MRRPGLSHAHDEIRKFVDRLRLAQLGPDADFFDGVLDDNFVAVTEDGSHSGQDEGGRSHQPGNVPKFTRAEMSDSRL